MRYKSVAIVTRHIMSKQCISLFSIAHLCRIKVWNRRHFYIWPQIVVLTDVGALVKFMHIVEESCLACSLVSVDYRVDIDCLLVVLIMCTSIEMILSKGIFLPDPLAPTQTVRVIFC